jgi:2-oxoglutarate ferredoxin oxidoreductase subunit alpha
VGGIEKEAVTGNVSYMPENHERMTQLRHEKVARIARDIPLVEVNGPESGELLVVGWGSTYGAIASAVDAARERGHTVSQVHLRHLNPFPSNLGEVLGSFEKILVPELNRGQLSRLLRAEYLVPAELLSKVQGQPFKIAEIVARIEEMLA